MFVLSNVKLWTTENIFILWKNEKSPLPFDKLWKNRTFHGPTALSLLMILAWVPVFNICFAVYSRQRLSALQQCGSLFQASRRR
ncbi:hypothetical protein Metme_1358 [Methylomonas methanica MC09]|uniref:Uncharacterized protein n=1 Tax=Methylomonas methanica (strain DSM 25384 / MC09) TaxID=857087 RepID=F9ZY51_METMM|nr:hypothetical protein Metme_1358 [Methylomonas methanica MC09]